MPTVPQLFLLDIRTDGEPSFIADTAVGAESDNTTVFQIDVDERRLLFRPLPHCCLRLSAELVFSTVG